MEEPISVPSSPSASGEVSQPESPVTELVEPLTAELSIKQDQPVEQACDAAESDVVVVEEEVETSSGKLIDGADVLDNVGNSDPGTPYEALGSTSASASEDELSPKPRRSEVKLQGISPDGTSMLNTIFLLQIKSIYFISGFLLPHTKNPLSLHPIKEWTSFDYVKNLSGLSVLLLFFKLPGWVCEYSLTCLVLHILSLSPLLWFDLLTSF
jgi:hypothetical protein